MTRLPRMHRLEHTLSFWIRLFLGATVATVLAGTAPRDAAAAECPAGALSVLPAPGTTLPPNGRIVLEGSGSFVPLLRELASRKPALAPAGKGAVIPLGVAALHLGDSDVAQAVLVPSRPLAPATRYTLRLHGAAPG